MSEHDKLAEARAMCPCWGDGAFAATECVGDEGVVCELHAKIAAALAAARAEGAAEAYAKAVATVERARASWTDDPTADEALEMARNLVLALAEAERGGRRA